MPTIRILLLVIPVALAAACGGGAGAAVAFGVSGTVPADGSVSAPLDSAIAITFATPSDLSTVTASTIRLERIDGTPVSAQLLKQDFNRSTVRLQPVAALEENVQYRVIISGSIQSADGSPLGADRHACFITRSLTPTVRPDQIVDLGDALNVPRYEGRWVRMPDGRFFVFGGFADDTTATDTVEEWVPGTRTWRLLAARMLAPRAEHTVTLMSNGNVLIAGGVSAPGEEPLASTELFNPAAESVSAGPDMAHARRWHGASQHFQGDSVMVSGGFGTGGAMLDSVEFLENGGWTMVGTKLPVPTAQHVQANFEFDKVYFSVGNFDSMAALFDGVGIRERPEGDIRFRAAAQHIGIDRLLVVGGDTRSAIIYDVEGNITFSGSNFVRERRGSHTMTSRGTSGVRFLVAGGFNIARPGVPALTSLEIVDFLGVSPFGIANINFYDVSIELPAAFAGHVGFMQNDGSTVLAGGWGGDIGAHSRRTVLVLDTSTSPTAGCAGK